MVWGFDFKLCICFADCFLNADVLLPEHYLGIVYSRRTVLVVLLFLLSVTYCDLRLGLKKKGFAAGGQSHHHLRGDRRERGILWGKQKPLPKLELGNA